MPAPCLFCTLPPSRIAGANDLAVWVYDAYPVSAGNSLMILRRHVGSFFEATEAGRTAMLSLLSPGRSTGDVLQ